MAEYIGYLRGNRGQVSRLGSKNSGMVAEARGWDRGGNVSLVDDDIILSINGGSHSKGIIAAIKISPAQFELIKAGKMCLCFQPIDGGK
jgi:hypothetical protein